MAATATFSSAPTTFQLAADRVPEADDAVARFATWARPLLGGV
ncbi:hypothetical protein ACQEVB_12770 [Pseudonocardia sp. CA-107938]